MLRTQYAVAKDWCYTGVGIMPNDAGMRDYLAENDYTYPIVARTGTDSDNMSVEVEEVGLHALPGIRLVPWTTNVVYHTPC